MKRLTKLFVVLLCLAMMTAWLSIVAFAANGTTNVALSGVPTEVSVGDIVTVTLSFSDMKAATLLCGVRFDNTLLECTSIVGPLGEEEPDYFFVERKERPKEVEATVSNLTQANTNSQIGLAVIGTGESNYYGNVLFTATFVAKSEGTAVFTAYEDSDGTDGYRGDAATATLTIKAAAPSCDHSTTKLVPNGNGTHKVVCANEECGATIEGMESVPCTGTDDGDCTTAVTCVCGYTVTAANAAHTPEADDGDCTTAVKCANCDEITTAANAAHTPEADDGDCTTAVKCANCDEIATAANANHTGGEATCTDKAECAVCGKEYGEFDDDNHSGEVEYTNNDKNHSATYDCCGAAYVTNEAHTYTNHVCVCGYVEMFVITMDANGGKFINGAPVYPVKAEYGAPFNAVPADPTKEGYKFVSWNTKADGTGDDIDLTPGTYTFTADLTVYAQWEVAIHSGWNEIDDEWYYYLDEQTKATGLTRVPYPTVAIDGVTYAPNAEDLAYYNANKDTSKYSDATTAVFYFDENGVFQNDYTGPVSNGSSYAVNGMAPWHVGMVKIGADYYYYSGDKTVGGNVLTTGKVYATRDCGTGLRVGAGVVYIFDEEGKLEKNQGIVDGYYYTDDYALAIGAGLVQIENDYYYVRSNGVVVVDREYWVAKTNDLEVVAGLYTFDADGKMVNPLEFDGAEDGIVELNGDLYYIKDGKCVVGAGVVKLTDAEGATFYIYVKSSGKLATGKYWPTNLNDLLDPGMYNWGADGKYYPAAN